MDLSENVEFGEELLTITCFKIMHNIFITISNDKSISKDFVCH